MDFAGEDDLLGFLVYSWSNSGQIARRRWFESPEGDFFCLASYVYVSSCLGSNARGCAAAILACVSGLRCRVCV